MIFKPKKTKFQLNVINSVKCLKKFLGICSWLVAYRLKRDKGEKSRCLKL